MALAELGDKTQLSVLLLSSKTEKHLHLLFGVILAFLIVDGIAIMAGSWIITIVPIKFVKMASGAIFIIFGLLMLMSRGDDDKNKTLYKNAFLSGFVLIFLTEWGDKTQISAALFATKFNVILVLCGTMIALTILSVMAVYFGKFISERINKKLLTRITGSIFIIMGVLIFLLP